MALWGLAGNTARKFIHSPLSPLLFMVMLGMGLLGQSWFAREALLRRAAGQGPNAPRLARGESLGFHD